MSYQEKRTIAGMISGALVLSAYFIYAAGRYRAGTSAPGDVRFWAGAMLVFIGIGIVVAIIIQILFHILLAMSIAVKERNRDGKEIDRIIGASMVEDEMDRLIELKASKVGFVTAGIGFIAALISLVVGYSPVVMLHVLFLAFGAGSMFEGAAHLYFYRKGIRNG